MKNFKEFINEARGPSKVGKFKVGDVYTVTDKKHELFGKEVRIESFPRSKYNIMTGSKPKPDIAYVNLKDASPSLSVHIVKLEFLK